MNNKIKKIMQGLENAHIVMPWEFEEDPEKRKEIEKRIEDLQKHKKVHVFNPQVEGLRPADKTPMINSTIKKSDRYTWNLEDDIFRVKSWSVLNEEERNRLITGTLNWYTGQIIIMMEQLANDLENIIPFSRFSYFKTKQDKKHMKTRFNFEIKSYLYTFEVTISYSSNRNRFVAIFEKSFTHIFTRTKYKLKTQKSLWLPRVHNIAYNKKLQCMDVIPNNKNRYIKERFDEIELYYSSYYPMNLINLLNLKYKYTRKRDDFKFRNLMVNHGYDKFNFQYDYNFFLMLVNQLHQMIRFFLNKSESPELNLAVINIISNIEKTEDCIFEKDRKLSELRSELEKQLYKKS